MHLIEAQINAFVDDEVWKELLVTWQERKDQLIQEILNGTKMINTVDPSTQTVSTMTVKLDIDEIHYRRGQVKELDFAMIQPELIIAEIKEANKTEIEK